MVTSDRARCTISSMLSELLHVAATNLAQASTKVIQTIQGERNVHLVSTEVISIFILSSYYMYVYTYIRSYICLCDMHLQMSC